MKKIWALFFVFTLLMGVMVGAAFGQSYDDWYALGKELADMMETVIKAQVEPAVISILDERGIDTREEFLAYVEEFKEGVVKEYGGNPPKFVDWTFTALTRIGLTRRYITPREAEKLLDEYEAIKGRG